MLKSAPGGKMLDLAWGDYADEALFGLSFKLLCFILYLLRSEKVPVRPMVWGCNESFFALSVELCEEREDLFVIPVKRGLKFSEARKILINFGDELNLFSEIGNTFPR